MVCYGGDGGFLMMMIVVVDLLKTVWLRWYLMSL